MDDSKSWPRNWEIWSKSRQCEYLEKESSLAAPTDSESFMDTYPDSESDVENLWHKQGGINPDSGKMWLTPRMHRNAAILKKRWEKE